MSEDEGCIRGWGLVEIPRSQIQLGELRSVCLLAFADRNHAERGLTLPSYLVSAKEQPQSASTGSRKSYTSQQLATSSISFGEAEIRHKLISQWYTDFSG